ncbi:MAG: hypothetical protein KDA60_04630 [Planctomycetales bacterium]|nr:hypothetical protein [Planctomycetales bacterium]
MSDAKEVSLPNVFSGNRVRVAQNARAIRIPSSDQGAMEINVVKEGDVVTRIEVVCSCGQRTWLDCRY